MKRVKLKILLFHYWLKFGIHVGIGALTYLIATMFHHIDLFNISGTSIVGGARAGSRITTDMDERH